MNKEFLFGKGVGMTSVALFGALVICQDCGDAQPFSVARHDGDELCDCGGDYCGCLCCNENHTSQCNVNNMEC